MKLALLPLLLVVAMPAGAFTPESGWWWNPAESGRGFNLEIQDDVVFMSVYAYEEDGRPVWYLAIGTLQNDRFSATLDRFQNGQCIGCDYEGEPDSEVGFAGPVEIRFDTSTQGELTWNGGETVPIQRHNFFLGDEIDLMLGRWQMVTDVSGISDDVDPFFGDVLVFDRDTTDGVDDFFEGYRPHSEYDRAGRPEGRPELLGDAAGLYEPETGLHVIVVDDSDDFWLAYYLSVGMNRFEGIAEFYRRDEEATREGYPVTGFRAAGRSAVQNAAAGKATADAAPGEAARDPALAGPGPKSLESLLGAKSARSVPVAEAVRRLQGLLEARAAGTGG